MGSVGEGKTVKSVEEGQEKGRGERKREGQR